MSDFDKVLKVIRSCKTMNQLMVASNMVLRYHAMNQESEKIDYEVWVLSDACHQRSFEIVDKLITKGLDK